MGEACYPGMEEDRKKALNLYRIMADVCAGSRHGSASKGEFVIVTVWVRADSMSAAFARAGVILDSRCYSSIGTLHGYAEELFHDPISWATDSARPLERWEDRSLVRYDALRESALARADGLHEVWLGDTGHQFVAKPSKQAQAA